MASGDSDSDLGQVTQALTSSHISKQNQPPIYNNGAAADGVQVTCFSEVVHDSTTLHFHIIRLARQIYVWIGYNSAKLGHLYAAAPTRPSTVSVTSIVGGSSDNTGSGIARRLVSRTGLNIILVCNIPKNNPMVEQVFDSVVQPIFMTSLNFDDQDGVRRSITDAPPTHYTLKINSLSMLSKNSLEKYESGEFEAGGYEWKLVFYPNGNKGKNVKEHISLYLVMAGANTSQIHWGVHAVFRLFLLDQNTGNYLVFQEEKERRFHAMKLEWGFDQFLSTKAFNEASNGFLVDDACVLGAEVFVSKERSMGKGVSVNGERCCYVQTCLENRQLLENSRRLPGLQDFQFRRPKMEDTTLSQRKSQWNGQSSQPCFGIG